MCLIVLGTLAGWTAFLRPPSLGGTTGYVIVSGTSMEPMLHTGDLAVVRQKAAYAIGDVVAYRIPDEHVGSGMLVIHRVIGGNADSGLHLQGDNREHPDMWRPRHADVVGAVQAHVPHAGTVLFLFRSPLVVATAAGLIGFWFIVLRGDDREDAETVEGDDPEPVAVEDVSRRCRCRSTTR